MVLVLGHVDVGKAGRAVWLDGLGLADAGDLVAAVDAAAHEPRHLAFAELVEQKLPCGVVEVASAQVGKGEAVARTGCWRLVGLVYGAARVVRLDGDARLGRGLVV